MNPSLNPVLKDLNFKSLKSLLMCHSTNNYSVEIGLCRYNN